MRFFRMFLWVGAAAAALLLNGCAASPASSRTGESQAEPTAAPLGSRIKRKSGVNPVAQAEARSEMDAARSQQNASHSRAYQK